MRFVVTWKGRYHPEFRTFDPEDLGGALAFARGLRTSKRNVRVIVGAVTE